MSKPVMTTKDFVRWVTTLPHDDDILGDFVGDTKDLADTGGDFERRFRSACDVAEEVGNALLRVYVPFVAHDNVDSDLRALYNATLPESEI